MPLIDKLVPILDGAWRLAGAASRLLRKRRTHEELADEMRERIREEQARIDRVPPAYPRHSERSR